MIEFKVWIKQTTDSYLSQNTFETLLLHFKVAVIKEFTKIIHQRMLLFGLDFDDRLLKAKYAAWETLNKASQLIETQDELLTFRCEYQKLITQK